MLLIPGKRDTSGATLKSISLLGPSFGPGEEGLPKHHKWPSPKMRIFLNRHLFSLPIARVAQLASA